MNHISLLSYLVPMLNIFQYGCEAGWKQSAGIYAAGKVKPFCILLYNNNNMHLSVYIYFRQSSCMEVTSRREEFRQMICYKFSIPADLVAMC